MRLALLTGGSRGLGQALTNQLESSGYHVIECSRSGSHAHSVHVDLSKPEQSREAFRNALAEIEAADLDELIVINNAGTLDPIGRAWRKPHEAVLQNLNTNFVSGIVFITEVIFRFQAAKGRKVIANISSGAALKGYAGWTLYCAAKAGMENFVRALALEQQSEQHPFIVVNVAPGLIDTDMQVFLQASSESDFPEVNRFIRRKAEGELRPPSEVAAAILRIVGQAQLVGGARYDARDFGG